MLTAFKRNYKILIFVSIWLSYFKIIGTSFKIVDLLALFNILLFMILIIHRKKYMKDPIMLILGVLSFSSFLMSYIYFKNMFIGARYVSSLMLPLYLTFLYPDIISKLRIFILKNIRFALALCFIFGFLQTNVSFFWTDGESFHFGLIGRATGLFANSAHNGVYIFMLIYTYIVVKKKINREDYLFLLMGYLGLFFSETRAVIGIAILSIPIYFFHQLSYFSIRDQKLLPKRLFIMVFLFFILPLSLVSYIYWDTVYYVYEALSSVFKLRINAPPNFEVNYSSEYCFNMQGEEYLDQSLGHRLERLIFIYHTVLDGHYWYGHGLGRCIGGGADNQLARITNDLGLIGLILNICLYIAIFFVAIKRRNFRYIYLLLTILYLGLFYDILYLQLSVVCIGIILIYLRNDNEPEVINYPKTE